MDITSKSNLSEKANQFNYSNEYNSINAFDSFVLSVFGMALFGILIWFTVGP